MSQLIDLGKLRFYFAGTWDSTATYESNDIVKYGGNVYVYTYALKTSSHLPTETDYWALMVEGIKFQGVYDSARAYRIGDGIAYGGKVYISIKDSTNQTPPNATYWSQFVDGIQYEGTYSNTAQYQKNDVVTYGGQVYIAKQDTNANNPTNTVYWNKLVDGIAANGIWLSSTNYVPGDLVAYGANLYKAIANNTNQNPTDTTGVLNSTYWQLFTEGIRNRNEWATGADYFINDVVYHGGTTYICVRRHASTTFETDLAATNWTKFNSGIRWRSLWTTATSYYRDDVIKNSVGSAYIATRDHTSGSNFNDDLTAGKWTQFVIGGADVLPVIQNTDTGQSLTVGSNGSTIDWIGATQSAGVYYVAPHGVDDANQGKNMTTPFASIKYACQQAGTNATIFVKTGTYNEQLPITVGNNVAIVGDNQRTVIVQPKTGNSDDGTTPNSQATMFLLGDGSILNKMTFKGMTGWSVPSGTNNDITTSTIKGVVVRLNPASPIVYKSPYVLECAAIGSGCVGALVDGSVHSSGNRSMLFHGYTIIGDNGVGYWCKDNGKAEIVSCFTYYCSFGYATSGGGQIRALNGNNSYGTYGVTSSGYDSTETPVTGAIYGSQLNFTSFSGLINVGDTVSNGSGASAVVTNVQTSSNKIYIGPTTGTFNANDTITATSGGTFTLGSITGQKGFVLVLNNLVALPLPGASISIAGDTSAYVIQSVSGTWTNTSSVVSVVLAQEKPSYSTTGSAVSLRYKYSRVRLTGHDFLSIGTGGISTTNYPGTPTQTADQSKETYENLPGRVFFVNTDQDGNFRVGKYFAVNQATGSATLNANAFNLSGLTSLRLGSIGAQLGAQIDEFSTDGTLSQNSAVKVPTQSAVKTYVDTAVGAIQLDQLALTNTISTTKSLPTNKMTFSMDTLTISGSAVYTVSSGAYHYVMNPQGFALSST